MLEYDLQHSGKILWYFQRQHTLRRRKEEYWQGETSPLPGVWEELYSTESSQRTLAHSHRREAASLLGVWETLFSSESSEKAPAYSHGRETLLLLRLWEEIFSE